MSFQEYMFRISWWKSFGFTAFRRSVEIAWVVARIKSVISAFCTTKGGGEEPSSSGFENIVMCGGRTSGTPPTAVATT